jgi:Rrf2 family cysteine metabolism transcriptional repressor
MDKSAEMKISAKSEYACLAVLALAGRKADEPPVRIREISETHAIPERYLVQILLQLKASGLVTSTRGAFGGYRLARPASAISVGEVLTAMEGADTPAREPQGSSAMVLEKVWELVRAAERSVLDKTSIAQLAERSAPREWVI